MEKPVIIIGAGVAGLAAAQTFRSNGIDTIILEAQNRIGGRVYTNEIDGKCLDYGAAWIHGVYDNPISELIMKVKASSHWMHDESTALFLEGGKRVNEIEFENCVRNGENFYQFLCEKVDHFDGSIQKFADLYLNETENHRYFDWILHEYMAGSGAELHEIDARAYLSDEVFDGGDALITGGYHKIFNNLIEDQKIQLNKKVVKIETGPRVKVICADGEKYEGVAVLLTASLGVLQSDLIEFFPPLPAVKKKAIQKMGMGLLNKVFCFFDESFWPSKVEHLGLLGSSNQYFSYVLNLEAVGLGCGLCFFAYGNQAQVVEQKSEQELKFIIDEILGRFFNHAKPIQSLYRTKWLQDPYALGSYSFIPTGESDALCDHLQEPVFDQLFFAGEATIKEYRGTVHGAYMSGQRQAQKIMQLYF